MEGIMGRSGCILLILVAVVLREEWLCYGQTGGDLRNLSRDDFPPGFIFGAGTSAYQVEGAADEDGRGASVWDTFTRSGRMFDHSTGDVASDQYHKYKEDVKLMADTGLDAFRFSISWSRLLPKGRGEVNPKGVAYYNNLIDELLKYGIRAHVTLFHLDLPQAIEDDYGGWLSPKIIEDFTAYADLCFKEFGDRVSEWTSIVEPNIMAVATYDNGVFPPNRCSSPFGIFNCTHGDSTREPYIAFHNLLLAHAAVVKLYRTKYQQKQHGLIGLNVYSYWCYPYSNSTLDAQASQRALDFLIGWVLNPLVFGDYPEVMKKIVKSRLPAFTEEEAAQVKGSFDYIGINHYSSMWIMDNSSNASSTAPRDYTADLFATFAYSNNSTPIGQLIPTDGPIDPAGLQHILEYIRDTYGNPPIYVEENGFGFPTNDTILDVERVNYLSGFIASMRDAVSNGSNVKGYFVWSLLDVFEFLAGYQLRFGLYHVDFTDAHRTRQPRLSARWYSKFLKAKPGVKISRGAPYGNHISVS